MSWRGKSSIQWSIPLLCAFYKFNRSINNLSNVHRSGFSDAEIELFLNKYNIDISQLMNDTENKRIIHDLELEGLDFSQNVYQSDIEQLRRRVDRYCKLFLIYYNIKTNLLVLYK